VTQIAYDMKYMVKLILAYQKYKIRIHIRVNRKMRPLRPTRPYAYAHLSTMVNPAPTIP
jgi:hypothetical protein